MSQDNSGINSNGVLNSLAAEARTLDQNQISKCSIGPD